MNQILDSTYDEDDMSSNDLTENLADVPTTKPTLETVLERINQVGEALTLRMNELDQRMTDVATNVAQLRNDIEQGFRRVERKIELLNNDFLEIRSDQEDLLRRVEELERKAS